MLKTVWRIFALLLVILSLMACKNTDNAGQSDFPIELLLHQTDLPPGFKRKEFLNINDIPNARALAIGFVVSDGSNFPGVRISHRLAVYPDEQTAQAAYLGLEKEMFPVDDWKTPVDFDFEPANAGDLYRFGCLPGYFDGKWYTLCNYVQQHNNIVSDILANLDDQFLKLEDVKAVLESLDARMSQVK